jgi:hypothetical protein
VRTLVIVALLAGPASAEEECYKQYSWAFDKDDPRHGPVAMFDAAACMKSEKLNGLAIMGWSMLARKFPSSKQAMAARVELAYAHEALGALGDAASWHQAVADTHRDPAQRKRSSTRALCLQLRDRPRAQRPAWAQSKFPDDAVCDALTPPLPKRAPLPTFAPPEETRRTYYWDPVLEYMTNPAAGEQPSPLPSEER